jgi:hypothetical protein
MTMLKAHDATHMVELTEALLEKGIVIEGWTGIRLLGLDFVEIHGRLVVTSVETYLRYANVLGGLALP